MKVYANGKELNIKDNATIQDLILQSDIKTTMYAVEMNLSIIPKKDYSKVILKEEDKVEIVNFVGGG